MKIHDPILLSALKNADNFMICAHINPDGDAVGSMLAMGRLLRALGKTVTMVSQDPVPAHLLWLPDARLIRPVAALADLPVGAALCVDASESKRMGAAWPYFEAAPLRIVIDHHAGTPVAAECTVVDPSVPAAGEMVFALWEALGVPLDREAAAQI